MKIPQKSIRWLGIWIESLYMAMPMLSIVNFVSLMILVYESKKADIPSWISLPVFLGAVAVGTMIGTLLAWIFLVPSLWSVRGQQMFGKETRSQSKFNGDASEFIEEVARLVNEKRNEVR